MLAFGSQTRVTSNTHVKVVLGFVSMASRREVTKLSNKNSLADIIILYSCYLKLYSLWRVFNDFIRKIWESWAQCGIMCY